MTVHSTFETPVTEIICEGESILLGGTQQTQPGTYYDTLQSINSCDSVIATTLIVNPSYEVAIATSICDGESILLGGTQQTISGTYYDTLQTANNCDSVIITTLTVNPNQETQLTATICDNETFFVGGAAQNTSGTYYDTLTTWLGCDSVLVTELTVLPTFATTIEVEICVGETYIAGGFAQNTPGAYIDTLTAINGCDSVLTTNLIVHPIYQTPVTEIICQGESILSLIHI